MKPQDYWNTNLDTDNRSRNGGAAHTDLAAPLAFARTPEFEWLQHRAGDLEGRLLVELGGGVGMHALLWAQAGARVVVVDLALERLKTLRHLAEQAGLADRILFVTGRAEALPLRGDSVHALFCKSVLIHTDLARAAEEIHRVLTPGGCGLFIEPLNRNPLIRLYRRLFAPKIWRSITTYFDAWSLVQLRKPFGRLAWKPFYLLAAGSFFWQYGRKNLDRFRKSLPFWMRADRFLLSRWPRLEHWCWFASIEVRKAPTGSDPCSSQKNPE
jgi:SAM-dependent methyltransferase